MAQQTNILPLSKLKGISIYYENDLYDTAFLTIRLSDARAQYDGSNAMSRLTVNGLGKIFAQVVNSCYPDYERVFSVIEKYGLPLGAMIQLDDAKKC